MMECSGAIFAEGTRSVFFTTFVDVVRIQSEFRYAICEVIAVSQWQQLLYTFETGGQESNFSKKEKTSGFKVTS